MSLDALRGFDMMWIMGLSSAVVALCSLFGAKDCWLAQQMTHVSWEGFRHHDTIFPLFLFLAGASWPFSCAAQQKRGNSTGAIVLKIFRRAAVLILFGLIYSGLFKFDFAHLRIPSVLAFIGVGWAGAALLYLFIRKMWIRALIVFALMVGYWALLRFSGAPDAPAGAGPFTYAGNISGYVDRMLFGMNHIIGKGDPEGLLSMMCGIAAGSLGVFAGELVRSTRLSGERKVLMMFGFSALLLALGFAWQPWCPVIKKLWTPTFALFAGGYSAAMFALFYWICDVKMWRGWTFPFRVIGMNSITIYMFARIVGLSGISKFFLSGVASLGNEHWSAFVIALGQVAVGWVVLWFLYRKNTFLKV